MRSNPVSATSIGSKLKVLAVVAGVGIGAAGCSGGGVALEGQIFDMMGVSSEQLDRAREEREVVERAPLVVPPSTERLPAPGSVGSTRTAALDPAWPQDADATAKARAKEREAQVKAYCDDREWLQRTKPEEFARVTDNGQLCSGLGSLMGSIFGAPGQAEDDDAKVQ